MNLPSNTIQVTFSPVPRLLSKQHMDLGSRTALAKPDKEQYKSEGCHMTSGGSAGRRAVSQSLFRTHWATRALVFCICFKIRSLSYSSQITTLERRRQAGRGEMGDGVLQDCGERRGLLLMLGSRGVERRRNVCGRGKKKPEALEAGISL